MTQNNLGNAYSDLPVGDRADNLQKAIECYQRALAVEHLAPWSRTRYLRNLGGACSEAEDYASAIAAYRRAIDLTPDDPWLFNALGGVYSRQQRHEQAVQAYTAALSVVPAGADEALLLRNRAEAFIRLDRLGEAEKDYERARALAPDHLYTHVRLGQLALAREEYAAVVEHYSAVIDREPEAGFYFDRGLAYLALGRPDEAVADYQAAMSCADADTIAGALEKLDEFAAARADLPGLDAVRALFSVLS
jgi:tetratricopeptide (TPR) repeat protein